ncbi:hypothetical protein P168DRAFT_304660 [Aspergillus campestris IBT 28561]|uniref:Ras guanyl-nucleotide exchange factor RasGEF n=1 Tax=Aspergillus campestris (strain IBT 28561) TaxID=1392248 RepID=A0A2I1D3A3_ASPC2|nr:uncharacterized protein P168DRAFT_304660 [Aspergillus campestris IBT 28561]PKY04361.1 hypothetical protein P168DRAFT_304660 [Aspergillus campestris IBT 28561]
MDLKTQALRTYRAILRELPRRTPPSPLQTRLRTLYQQQPSQTPQAKTEGGEGEGQLQMKLQQAEQWAMYARAQRKYAALVERYNPGATLTEEEKIRLTARRVGWDLPDLSEVEGEKGGA